MADAQPRCDWRPGALRAQATSVESFVHAETNIVLSREMFGRYRQLVEELADGDVLLDDWFHDLQMIVFHLDLETRGLNVSSSKILYDELSEQFEQEAYLTDNDQRRKVLLAATKLLELKRPVA